MTVARGCPAPFALGGMAISPTMSCGRREIAGLNSPDVEYHSTCGASADKIERVIDTFE
jgi:hypothetical protein